MAVHPAGTAVPPARRHGTVASYLWAGVPLVTIGMGTWAAFLFAAVKRRSWWLGGASAVYAALLAVWFIAMNPAEPGPLASALGTVAAIAAAGGGFAHALAVRTQVFGYRPAPADEAMHEAEHESLRRRKLREEARALATRDPALARELGIGRPDLPRSYDDGGLVDVNHAPAAVLATLPGLDLGLAGRAVEERTVRGPFVSADDLALTLELPAGWVPALAELTIYLG